MKDLDIMFSAVVGHLDYCHRTNGRLPARLRMHPEAYADFRMSPKLREEGDLFRQAPREEQDMALMRGLSPTGMQFRGVPIYVDVCVAMEHGGFVSEM